MKLHPILLINQYYEQHRGAFNVFFGVERALRWIGYEPIVFASRTSRSLPNEYSRYFPPGFNRAELASATVPARIRLAAEGLYSWRARRALRSLIKDTAPVAAIVFRPEYQLTWSVLSELKRNRVPTILWILDYRFWCTQGFLYNPALRARCERCVGGNHVNAARYRCANNSLPMSIYDAAIRTIADTALNLDRVPGRYVVPSGPTRDLVTARLGLPADRVHVIPHPVRLSEFDHGCPPGSGGYVAFYGRLSPEKGVSVLLDAIRAVGTTRLEIYGLDILGNEDRTRADIARLGLTSQVTLETDLRFSDELLRRLCSAMFIVNPSVWPDTLEYTVLESMALGKAVIVTDGGGNAEVVRRAECGLIVPPGDPRALAEAIRTLTLDPAMARRFGLAGRAYVQKELSEERFASRVRHLIETMLPADGPIPA